MNGWLVEPTPADEWAGPGRKAMAAREAGDPDETVRVLITGEASAWLRRLEEVLGGDGGLPPDNVSDGSRLEEHIDGDPEVVVLEFRLHDRRSLDVLRALRPSGSQALFLVSGEEGPTIGAFDEGTLGRLASLLGGEAPSTSKSPSPSSDDDLSRLLIRRKDRRILVDLERVSRLEAAGNYVRVHVDGDESHLTRTTLKDLDAKLGDSFVRIHRSTIVRREDIREFRPTGNGDYDVVLEDGSRLRMSRSYRDDVAGTLGVEL